MSQWDNHQGDCIALKLHIDETADTAFWDGKLDTCVPKNEVVRSVSVHWGIPSQVNPYGLQRGVHLTRNRFEMSMKCIRRMLQLSRATSIRAMHDCIPLSAIVGCLEYLRFETRTSFYQRYLHDVPPGEEGSVVGDDLTGSSKRLGSGRWR